MRSRRWGAASRARECLRQEPILLCARVGLHREPIVLPVRLGRDWRRRVSVQELEQRDVCELRAAAGPARQEKLRSRHVLHPPPSRRALVGWRPPPYAAHRNVLRLTRAARRGAAWSKCSLGSAPARPCTFSARAWRPRAACHSQSEAPPQSAQPPPRGLKRAASKVADFTAVDHPHRWCSSRPPRGTCMRAPTLP